MNELNLGRYRHYKGNEYTVIGIAHHSETLEELVVYRQEYGEHGLWVRPKQMFLETVKVDGQDVPRFQHLALAGEKGCETVTVSSLRKVPNALTPSPSPGGRGEPDLLPSPAGRGAGGEGELLTQNIPDAETSKNLFDDLPQHLPKEFVQTLISTANVRIERIISHGHASPPDFWYDQSQHEWVVVLKGAARLQFEDGIVEMKPGDFINIPAYKKHRVEWTTPDEPTIWLGVRYGGIS